MLFDGLQVDLMWAAGPWPCGETMSASVVPCEPLEIFGIGTVEGAAQFTLQLGPAVAAFAVGPYATASGAIGPSSRRNRAPIVNMICGPKQFITAIAPPAAGNISGTAQRGQDLLDELARQFLLFTEFADVHSPARLGPGKGDKHLEGVTGALGNHE